MSFMEHEHKTDFAMRYGTARQHHAIIDGHPPSYVIHRVAEVTDHKEVLDRLTSHKDDGVRIAVAERGHKDHLDRLVSDRHPEVRSAVAEHGHKEHLDKLINDPRDDVRHTVACVAKHPEHIEKLAKDEDPYVVNEIARKHPHMHDELAKHPSHDVRRTVAYNGDEKHLTHLMHDSDDSVRAVVAARSGAAHLSHIHDHLMHDPVAAVRGAVARNTDMDRAQKMTQDPEHYVKVRAQERVLEHNRNNASITSFKDFNKTV